MRTQSIIALLTAFSFIISTVNLYTFWTPFGINIFDHLTTSEILVRSVKPLFLGIGVLLTTAFLEIHEEELRPEINEIQKRKTIMDKFTHFVMSTFGLQIIGLGMLIQYKSETNFHITAYSIGGIVLTMQIMIKIGTYQKAVNKYNIPKNSISLAMILLAMTTSSAYSNAENIKDRIYYTRAEVTFKENNDKVQKIYIGETQSTLFFYSFKSNRVTEINRKEILKVVKSDSSCEECKFEIENN